MKNPRNLSSRRGFTLMELMVAMAITTIIVTVLVSITSIALETWNRSRSELKASRQAKSMIDTLARDFESLVVRRGNNNQWLSALAATDEVGDSIASTNATEYIFFTAVTDRYNGQVGVQNEDKGGDVSCVAYKLYYRNPLDSGSNDFETFVVNRLLVDPDDTFEKLLGETDSTDDAKTLDRVFAATTFSSDLEKPENFVCENVFQFSVTFNVQVTDNAAGGGTQVKNVPVTIGRNNETQEFRLSGNGIFSDYTGSEVTTAELTSGRISSVDISVTVLSDFGIEQLSRRKFTDTQKADFLAKNSYEFTKTVQIPSM
ncbi:MAG: prepilin-type N-terminal cleavage/methylation domain-containing protein [Verrucomicrobiota bacterium]